MAEPEAEAVLRRLVEWASVTDGLAISDAPAKCAEQLLGAMVRNRDLRIQELEKQLVLIGEKAVVDWDDETVGQVNKLVPFGKYSDWLREVLTRASRG